MQLIKVRIRRGDPRKGEPQMVYPQLFSASEVHTYGIGHVHGRYGYSGHIGLGGPEEWTIIGVDDAVAAKYATDPDMVIITTTEADALIEEWRVFRGDPAEIITDPQRIQAIATKQAVGLPLTVEDRNALDPVHATRGINRLESTANLIDRANGRPPLKSALIGAPAL